MFSQIGESAGSRKRCNVCNAALNTAARHTNTRYGNRITARSAAASQRCTVAALMPHPPDAEASRDATTRAAIATNTIEPHTRQSQLVTVLTNANAPARCRACNSSFNVGTKAAVSAPSPSKRRKRFGSVNAV